MTWSALECSFFEIRYMYVDLAWQTEIEPTEPQSKSETEIEIKTEFVSIAVLLNLCAVTIHLRGDRECP